MSTPTSAPYKRAQRDAALSSRRNWRWIKRFVGTASTIGQRRNPHANIFTKAYASGRKPRPNERSTAGCFGRTAR